MIKIIGVKTDEEISQIYEEKRKEIEEMNKKCHHYNIWLAIWLLLIMIVAIGGISYSQIEFPPNWHLNVMVVKILIALFIGTVLLCIYVGKRRVAIDLSHVPINLFPITYQYSKITKKGRVLETKIISNTLKIVVSCGPNQGHQHTLSGFEVVIGADVDDIIVDLDEEKIYMPQANVSKMQVS